MCECVVSRNASTEGAVEVSRLECRWLDLVSSMYVVGTLPEVAGRNRACGMNKEGNARKVVVGGSERLDS